MKKLILTGLAIVLFSACQDQQRYTQTSAEIEITKKLIKDYNDQNWESLVSHYADTSNTFFNTKSNSIKSNQVPVYHQENDANFSSRGFTDEDQEYEMVVTDEGNTWVNFWGIWQGTLAANNKQLEIPVHLTAQFIDGKIVEEHGLWDNAPIVLAMQEIEAARMNEEGYRSNLEIVKSIYDNFAKGDIPAFLAVLDPKVEWNEAENFIYADGSPYIGPDAFVKGVLERIGADWEYWKIADLQLNDMTNSMVLGTGRYQAKNKKNGKVINAQVAHVWTLKNSKVVKFQQYTDTKQIAEAIIE